MTNAKTTAEQRVILRLSDEPHVHCLLDDLESAESRIRALENVVWELLNDGDNLADAIATIYEGTIHQLNWEDTRTKARAVLSEGATGEGK